MRRANKNQFLTNKYNNRKSTNIIIKNHYQKDNDHDHHNSYID